MFHTEEKEIIEKFLEIATFESCHFEIRSLTVDFGI